MATDLKAFTLWQPWASLIAWGAKRYETRHWKTHYRGLLAIHAGNRDDTQHALAMSNSTRSFFVHAFNRANHDIWEPLPRGQVLCVVQLIDCIPTEEVWKDITEYEKAFGDYSDGRYAWKLELVEVFKEPIPVKGAQGLWTWRKP